MPARYMLSSSSLTQTAVRCRGSVARSALWQFALRCELRRTQVCETAGLGLGFFGMVAQDSAGAWADGGRLHRGQDASLCTDICRESISFGSLPALIACLHDIREDPQLRVLRSPCR
eukprot:2227351-Rhodomonas_salina.1